ncbi:MAG: AMP-binding protein, partial [Clostridiaceae bacterium]|nr:AMP-binding protein [Clostridiaceae bacterium]
ILQTGAIVFDASTFEVWGSLLNGMTLYLVDEETILNPERLKKAIKENSITTMWLTSPLFNQLSQVDPHMFDGLKNLLVGGDVVSPKHVGEVKKACSGINIINGYGPTENTTFSTTCKIEREFEKSIPIGMPISNSTAYIVDRAGNLQPVGAKGELWVGGDGVGRGYLNNPELTQQKFIQNPFTAKEADAKKEAGRVYKTGDLARWLPDGSIEFLGRIDHQVKIRGFRIETGEVENSIMSLEGIKEAVVLVHGNTSSEKYLCAYYVAQGKISAGDLREKLKDRLPEYMIPSYFMQLEKMPLNKNGKIDRKLLPEPDGDLVTGTPYVEPENETEEKLVMLFKEILGVDKTGTMDSFFELGGHSLKATLLVSRIHKEFDVEMPLKEVFARQNVKRMASFITGAEEKIYSSIKSYEKKEFYPLSAAQKRMYIIDKIEGGTGYNIPAFMQIEGSIDKDRIEKVLAEIVSRHESFRTSFHSIDEEPVAKIHEKVEFRVELYKAHNGNEKELADSFVRPFDLGSAPLIRAGLIDSGDNKYILMFDMHHIISDGTSVGIFMNEFIALYKGKSLEPIEVQYRDYSQWQNELIKSGEIEKQENYWLSAFSGEIPVLNMMTDYKRPLVQSFEGDSIKLYVPQGIVEKIRETASETGSTMYMVLLAVYNVLLSKYTGQEDIIVGSPVAGRQHADLEGVIGMFVNTLAMRNFPAGEMTFVQFLKSVRDNALKAYENQDYQFEELVDRLSLKRDLSRNPLFDTVFSLQNMTGDIEEDLDEFEVTPYEYDTDNAKFDITVNASEDDENLLVEMVYCTKLFRRDTMERFSKHFLNILEKVLENPGIRLCDIVMLDDNEINELLVNFNGKKLEYPKDKTIIGIFEEQAARVPNNTAVVFKERALTYEELNSRANSLAARLIEMGAGRETITGIMVDPSLEMIVGVLGILKAGSAYLPIDPSYPEDRIDYMLKDSEAGILITRTHLLDHVAFKGAIVNLDEEGLCTGDAANPELERMPEDLAYIIYTSGSTGRPKGVMVEHRSLINLCWWHNHYYEVTSNDRATKYAGFGFDASVWEIFPYIAAG